MPVVSAGDLTLLRSEEHKSLVRTSFLIPPVLWEARINDLAIVKGETSIDFDGGNGSFFSMVEALQVAWVGTGIQKDDVGRLRVKSISSGDAGVTGTVVVAGHSHQLQNNQYLTFLHDYPIVPRHSFIEQVDPDTEIWYMDDDIAYSNQNADPPPTVIAGTDRAGFLDPTSGEWAINIDSSNSYGAAGATISSYAFSIASTAGTPTVNFNTGTGLGDITFDAAGYYWAKYSVTDSDAKTQVSYRLYYVHDLERSGLYPFIDCETVTLENEWENGGWVAGIKAQDEFSFAEIPDHTSCLIWGETTYDGTESQITFLDDNATTIFAGFVRGDSDARDWATGVGEIDFAMSTAEGILRNMHEFSTSLLAKDGTPSKWYEGRSGQTMRDILHNAWRWRTTIYERVDVLWEANDSWLRIFGGLDEGNPYDMANVFLYDEGIRARVLCDQGGRIHIVEDQQLMIDSDRSGLTTSFEITNLPQLSDYGGLMAIPRKPEFEVPFVTGNGIYWPGTWDAEGEPEVEEYCSIAPGGKPLWRGAMPQDKPAQTVISQDHLNKVIGRWEAKINNPVEEFRIELHGNYVGVFDCAYGHQYITDLQASDNPRGIVWSNKPLYLRNVRATYAGSTGNWQVGCSFEPEHVTTDGVYTECPSFPELGGNLPEIPAPAEIPGALLTGASVHYKSALGDLWDERLTQQVNDVVQDAFWRTKTGTSAPTSAIVFRCGTGYIKRTTDAFDTVDVDITPVSNPPNDSNDSPAPTTANVTFVQGESSYINQDEFVFLATWQNAGGDWRSWLLFTDDNGTSWAWKSLGGTPTLACQELSGTPGELDLAITDLRTPTWSMFNAPRQICEIDTDKYVVGYIQNSSPYDIYVQVVNVSTGSPVLGTKKLTALGGQTTSYGFTMCKVDTNKFAILDNYYADPQIQICTVSGSTITTGTATNWISNREIIELCGDANTGTAQSNNAYMPTLSSPSPTTLHIGRKGILVKWQGHVSGFCTRHTGFDGFHVCKGTISGTTFTPDTIDCNGEDINDWDTTLDGLPPRLTDSIRMSSTVSLAAFGYSGSEAYSRLVAYDNTTGMGSTAQFASGGTPMNFRLARLSDTKAILLFSEEGFPDSELFARVVTLTGTSIALGTNQLIYTYSGVSTYNIRMTEVSSTQVVATLPDTGGCQIVIEITANTTTNLITDYDVCSYGWPYVSTHDVHGIDADDFLVLRDAATISGTAYDPSVTIGSYAEVLACSPSYSGTSLALGLSIGKSAGDKVWITANRSDELFLLEYALPGLTQTDTFSLGTATFVATESKTWLAYPYVPFGYDDAVYVFGRMLNPQSLGNPSHVIRTTNGGSTWGLIEGGWLNDHCGALLVSGPYTYAIRNGATTAKLYRDQADNSLAVRYTLPFDAPVAPHGMIIDWLTEDLYICSWLPDPIMVVVVGVPYVTHSDLTFDHDNADGIEAIVRL